MVTVVIITALIALVFSFTNGMNDAANCIATVVKTKALPPKVAVGWAAFWIFAAQWIFPMTVAATMGKGIVAQECIDVYVILAALIGSVLWVLACTLLGLPVSASHALVGGLIGPVWFVYGSKFLVASGIIKTLAFIVISPLLGCLMGFTLNCIFLALFKKRNVKKVDKGFRRMQLLSSAAFSLGFGGNDGQKTMGVIAILFASAFAAHPDNPLMLTIFGHGAVNAGIYSASGQLLKEGGFFIPVWLRYTCYGLIAIGSITGGWKVIRTLGDNLSSRINPTQGFCAELSGALTLIMTAVLGIPVSTTHTITGSIIGTGLTRGVKRVKWVTAKNIVWAWVITIPAVVVVSGLIYLLMTGCFGCPVKII